MTSPQIAAIGFRIHTGWAAVIVISGRPERFDLRIRRRIELLPHDGSIVRFMFHQAAEMPLEKAKGLIEEAKQAARDYALKSLTHIHKEVKLAAAGIPAGATVLPDDLATILASHARIHAAEGQLFQNAIREACEHFRMNVVPTRERNLVVDETLRSRFGPPWGADQKLATASALEALKSVA